MRSLRECQKIKTIISSKNMAERLDTWIEMLEILGFNPETCQVQDAKDLKARIQDDQR